jgi:isoleucyl-tRNA synthetase
MTYPQVSTGPGDESGPAKVPASPSFPAMEERVLAFWKDDDTFRASVERNPAGENGANEFVFYDGPPFAADGSSAASAGTATGCRPSWRPCRSWG